MLKTMSTIELTPKGDGGGCLSSVRAAVYCFAYGVAFAGTVLYMITHGGCDEAETNSICPNPQANLQIKPQIEPQKLEISSGSSSCPPRLKCPDVFKDIPTDPPVTIPTQPVVPIYNRSDKKAIPI